MTEGGQVDPFLVVAFVIIMLVSIVVNLYVLVYWQSPQDKNDSYYAKAIVITGLTLCEGAVALLPLDVANNGGDIDCDGSSCGGLDMSTFWVVFFCMIAVFVSIIIPFCIFYYEADDGISIGQKKRSRFVSALQYEFAVIFVALLTLLLMFFLMGYTNIPVREFKTSMDNLPVRAIPDDFDINNLDTLNTLYPLDASDFGVPYSKQTATVELQVTFAVYVTALTGWVGWFFFAIFGGVGLAVLPIDLIAEFIWRPRYMDAVEYAEHQLDIQRRTAELVEVAELLKKDRQNFSSSGASFLEKRQRTAQDRVALNKLAQMVYVLEKDHADLKLCQGPTADYTPLIPYAKLLGGILGGVVSLLWFLHIVLFMLVEPPVTPFLNEYFIWFDSWFPLFGTLSYAIFAVYLFACTIKGCFKFGVRFFCLRIHPMSPGKTMMNSFMFNLAVIMLCCIPVVQFCAQAFRGYARNAAATNLFGAQIQHMKFFKEFYDTNAFVYILVILFGLSLIFFSLKPRDLPVSASEMKNELQQRPRRLRA